MHPDSDESIERLIRPLEHNAEIHLAARCYLLEQMEKAGGVEDKVAAFVKTRENGMPQRGASPRAVTSAATQTPGAHLKPWRGWFYLAVVALVVALSAPFAWQAYETWAVSSLIPLNPLPHPTKPYVPLAIRKLPERDRILLLGDESLDPINPEKWRALWKLEPANPVFLAYYATRNHGNTLSPEILEAAARIDPDNALYPLLQATRGWNSVAEPKTVRAKGPKPGKTSEWIIKDEAALEERIALIHRAVHMPALRDYTFDLRSRQRAILPQPEDTGEAFRILRYTGYANGQLSISPASKLLAAKASLSAQRGDVEGFQAAISDWKSLCSMSVRDVRCLVDALVAKSMLSNHLESFRDGAAQLGLHEDARRFDELDQLFKQMKADAKIRSKAPDSTADLITQKGTVFFSSGLQNLRLKTRTPPPITAEDLRPGRYTEHAWLGQALAVAASLIFLLLAGAAALCRFRQSALVRELSPCMAGLLRASDCLWIAGLGVLLPTAWFLTIQFLTPVGAREWSLRHTLMIGPCAQFGAAVLLVAVTALVTAGWRLGTRGAAFGLRNKRPWIGWTMVGSLALVIPAVGAFPGWPPTQSEEGMRIALGVCFTIPVLWLGISLLTNLVNRSESSLRRATHARLMIPTWMFVAAVFAALVPVYHQSEKHWFLEDRLMGLADPAVEFTRYEMELTKTLREELRELMDKHL